MLPCLQDPTSGLYPEPAESSPYLFLYYFIIISGVGLSPLGTAATLGTSPCYPTVFRHTSSLGMGDETFCWSDRHNLQTLCSSIILSGVRLSPLGTAATTGLLYQPQAIDDGACGGMRIGMGNRSTRREPSPALLCPPQIPRDQTRARTRPAAVGSQRLTA
jgi:hypothetical protein